MKKIFSKKVFYPDKSKIKKFLLPPVLFSLFACFLVVMFAGFELGGFISALVVSLVVCLPFMVLILPTFLFEKVIIESFTVTFYFMFIFFKFKKTLKLSEIKEIRQQYRNQRATGPKEIVIEFDGGTILLSEMKYKHDDIVELIYTLQQRNEQVTVSLL